MKASPSEFADLAVTVVGLGLIGGSIARGLKATGHRGRLVGCVADLDDCAHALRLELADRVTTDLADAVAHADLVVLAVPVSGMADMLAQSAPYLRADAVVTDVGSTKQGVMAAARTALGERAGRFVPGHPIAGTEYSGLDAGFATLFEGQRVILTPTPATAVDAVHRVEALWRALGGVLGEMDAAHHDAVLAATSHLPHVLAFALVDTLARMAERTEIFEYAAGGFADFTRIASSAPALWSDIVTANSAAVLPVLDRYIADLAGLRDAIEAHDRAGLAAAFGRAKNARDRFAQRRSASSG